mmetsp:Transcript_108714/g.307492  ORF Transcript_108714/g.307492 Transcript_108714/m.307492 type:complete len:170 (+) Transcript_108714:62-571(+)
MGQTGGICSASHPAGFCSHDSGNTKRPMEVTTADAVNGDHISPWTSNPNDRGPAAVMLACGANVTAAPADYLADTPNAGVVMVDSREGPIWMDEAEDRAFGLEPGELNLPGAAQRAGAGAGPPARGAGGGLDEASVTRARKRSPLQATVSQASSPKVWVNDAMPQMPPK